MVSAMVSFRGAKCFFCPSTVTAWAWYLGCAEPGRRVVSTGRGPKPGAVRRVHGQLGAESRPFFFVFSLSIFFLDLLFRVWLVLEFEHILT